MVRVRDLWRAYLATRTPNPENRHSQYQAPGGTPENLADRWSQPAGLASGGQVLGVTLYFDPPSPGSGEAVGVGGLLLDQRADGDVRPVDAVEVEHHQLRVL
jgi:hypothetical protein